jgi:hypothetical protein
MASAKAKTSIPLKANLMPPGSAVPQSAYPAPMSVDQIDPPTAYYEQMLAEEEKRQIMINALMKREQEEQAEKMAEGNRLQGLGLVGLLSGSQRLQRAGQGMTGLGSERLRMAGDKNPASVRLGLAQAKNIGEIRKQQAQMIRNLTQLQQSGASKEAIAAYKAQMDETIARMVNDARLRGQIYASDSGVLKSAWGIQDDMMRYGNPIFARTWQLPNGQVAAMDIRSGQTILLGDPRTGGQPVAPGQPPVSINIGQMPPQGGAPQMPQQMPPQGGAPQQAPPGVAPPNAVPGALHVPRPFTADDKRRLEMGAKTLWTIRDLKQRFAAVKPYVGYGPLSRAAEAGARVAGGVAGKKGEDFSAWWKNFRKEVELTERKDVFGATLTGYEIESWRAAQNVDPGQGPEKIGEALNRLEDATIRGNATRRQGLIDSGSTAEQIDSTLKAGEGAGASAKPTLDEIKAMLGR